MPTPTIEGFRSDTTEVRGVRLHHWVGGDPDGPPVLLWHGFLGTGYAWRKLAPRLAEAGFAVLVPDMRGYGDSDKPPGVEGYDGRSLAEDFRALVQATGFGAGRPITLVAHDMGAPGALLWAADHPEEITTLIYVDEPVLRTEFLSRQIVYTPEAAPGGSLWWWLLALAPGAPERIVVGKERDFLGWFYDRTTSSRDGVGAAIDEYARTFVGVDGVLGAFGVYRAVPTTVEQTEALTARKVSVPAVAVGGALSKGDTVRAMLTSVADDVTGVVVPGCAHFVPEERPDVLYDLVTRVLAAAS